MPKAKGRVGLKITPDVDNMQVLVQVWDYESETESDSAVFDFAELPDDIAPRVSLYGLAKVLSDRNSQVKENPKAKLDGMREVMERFRAGEWEAERTGGGLGVVSAEVQAIAELKGISIPDAQAALKAYDRETRQRILASSKVQERAKAIKTKREAAQPQKLDDLL